MLFAFALYRPHPIAISLPTVEPISCTIFEIIALNYQVLGGSVIMKTPILRRDVINLYV